MNEQAVRLYKCGDCILPKYQDYHVASGQPCKWCGSMKFKYAPPNRFYSTLYILHQDWSIWRKFIELFKVRIAKAEAEPITEPIIPKGVIRRGR